LNADNHKAYIALATAQATTICAIHQMKYQVTILVHLILSQSQNAFIEAYLAVCHLFITVVHSLKATCQTRLSNIGGTLALEVVQATLSATVSAYLIASSSLKTDLNFIHLFSKFSTKAVIHIVA
jgi:hypothetical protein